MKSTILIIEDDKNVRENLVDLLEEENYSVIALSNGKDIRNTLESNSFDLILCDIMMPGMNGYEVFNEVKKILPLNMPPFIFLTAKAEREDLRKGMELGADDYITKPFTRVEVLKAIQTRIEKRNNQLNRTKLEKEFLGILKDKTAKKSSRLTYDASIFLASGANPKLLKIAELVCIRSQRDYSELTTKTGECFRLKKTMKNWEKLLPVEAFMRVHRSTIINLNFIDKIDKWFNYTYKIVLKGNSEPIYVSQRYSLQLRKQLREK